MSNDGGSDRHVARPPKKPKIVRGRGRRSPRAAARLKQFGGRDVTHLDSSLSFSLFPFFSVLTPAPLQLSAWKACLTLVLFCVTSRSRAPRTVSVSSSQPPKIKMQSMQRKFGRMTTKRSADDSQVAVLLKDFEDADNLLAKVGSTFLVTRQRLTLVPDCRFHQGLARCLGVDCNLPGPHDR